MMIFMNLGLTFGLALRPAERRLFSSRSPFPHQPLGHHTVPSVFYISALLQLSETLTRTKN